MKKIIVTCFLFLALLPSGNGGEVTGAGLVAKNILRAHNISLQDLERHGYKLLFGEHTGAGKRLNLDRVSMLLTKNNLFHMNDASHIEFKHPSQAKSLNDVKHLEYGGVKLPASQVKAMVVKF